VSHTHAQSVMTLVASSCHAVVRNSQRWEDYRPLVSDMLAGCLQRSARNR
jgi:hypothetical protein